MIQIKSLTKFYGTNKVLDNVNLELIPNKIYGILGRNGAGKTTLVNIVTNRAFATKGSFEIDGDSGYENDKAQEKVFCITEKSAYPTIEKVSALFKWAKRFYPNFDMEYALKLAKRFDLELDKKLGKLSTGYTTIAKVVLTLASNAPYMIFDEPVLGIDAIYREVFYEELKATQKRLGNCMVLCTHIMDEAETVIDDVIILKKGQIVFNGTINEITKKQSLQNFYLDLHKKEVSPVSDTKETSATPKLQFGKIDFGKVKNSARYLFNLSWIHACIILAVIALFTSLSLIIKDIEFGVEIMLLINLFIMGMALHGYFFKYALYNGVSRRTYSVAVLSLLMGYAAFFSLMAAVSVTILHSGTDSEIMIKGLYPALFSPLNLLNFITIFGWLLFINIFFMVLALFGMIIFQALTRKGRYILMTVLTIIGIGFMLWGTFAGASLANVFMFIGGIKSALGAWFSVMWFTILSILFGFASWLILRRTEIK